MKSNKKRLNLMREFGSLYKRYYKCNQELCFYCGDPRDLLDHRPPISFAGLVEKKDLQKAKIPLLLIPCCSECNRWLGDKWLPTAFEAAFFVMRKLEERHEKASTLWSEEEIQELGYSLKTFVVKEKLKQQNTISRVQFAQRRVYVERDSFPDGEIYWSGNDF